MIERHEAVTRAYPIPGQTWPSELCWLYDTMAESKLHAEIGVYCGRSLFASCGGMSAATVVACDLPQPSVPGASLPSTTWARAVLDATIRSICEANPDVDVQFSGNDSISTAMQYRDMQFDSVFIDGSHHYADVVADIESWLPLVRPGGIISGHDYCTSQMGVMDAVNELLPGFGVVPMTRIWWKKL